MSHRSSAPTGHHAIAQGATLGIAPHRYQALKGRNLGRRFSPTHPAPSGRNLSPSFPGAMPRAIAFCPVGTGNHLRVRNPWRCHGLSHAAPLGQ